MLTEFFPPKTYSILIIFISFSGGSFYGFQVYQGKTCMEFFNLKRNCRKISVNWVNKLFTAVFKIIYFIKKMKICTYGKFIFCYLINRHNAETTKIGNKFQKKKQLKTLEISKYICLQVFVLCLIFSAVPRDSKVYQGKTCMKFFNLKRNCRKISVNWLYEF